MTAAKVTKPDDLRMSGDEFDRIMQQALQVRPEPKKPKEEAKPKTARKRETKTGHFPYIDQVKFMYCQVHNRHFFTFVPSDAHQHEHKNNFQNGANQQAGQLPSRAK